jgi:hypothetical protein
MFYTYWKWLKDVKKMSDEERITATSNINKTSELLIEYKDWLTNNEKQS